MTIDIRFSPDSDVSCARCEACCCRLEVMLITDTGVPDHFIVIDQWGGRSMARQNDGWCSALNRNTMMCMIYKNRPQNCRDFEMGGYDCNAERTAWL